LPKYSTPILAPNTLSLRPLRKEPRRILKRQPALRKAITTPRTPLATTSNTISHLNIPGPSHPGLPRLENSLEHIAPQARPFHIHPVQRLLVRLRRALLQIVAMAVAAQDPVAVVGEIGVDEVAASRVAALDERVCGGGVGGEGGGEGREGYEEGGGELHVGGWIIEICLCDEGKEEGRMRKEGLPLSLYMSGGVELYTVLF
jgi:hypothetical protein